MERNEGTSSRFIALSPVIQYSYIKVRKMKEDYLQVSD